MANPVGVAHHQKSGDRFNVARRPSAKITTWDQAMYFFYAAPSGYRKVFFVLKGWSPKKQETLAQYYVRTKHHLIQKDVEVWEFGELHNTAKRIKKKAKLFYCRGVG